MIRNIIKIDEEKCIGCGLCVNACHEGAIQMIDGKAKLVRDDYCDGLGNCLPVCPTGAITIEEREADAFDEEAVKKSKATKQPEKVKGECHGHTKQGETLACGCSGSMSKEIKRETKNQDCACESQNINLDSQLSQWPVQIKLVPVNAPYFNNARLLIAADCTPFAYANFHNEFIKNHITLIGCPKLDDIDYSIKLTEIIKISNIKSITVVRMEVPCCGGLSNAVTNAIKNSGKMIPWKIVTITTDGNIQEE